MASAQGVVALGCGRPFGRWRRLGAPTPLLVSPLEGGRDELGKRAKATTPPCLVSPLKEGER